MESADIHGLKRKEGAVDYSTSSTANSQSLTGKRKRTSTVLDYAAEIKTYKCKFCPATFSQSQALGGHMNRHRREKMNEQIIHAHGVLAQHGISTSITLDQNTARPSMPIAHLQRPSIYTLNQSGVNNGVSSAMMNIQPDSIQPFNLYSGSNWGDPLLNVQATATGLCEGNLSDTVPAIDDDVAALFQSSDHCRPSPAYLEAFRMPCQQQFQTPSMPLYSNPTDLSPLSIQRSICLNDIQRLQSQYELLRNVSDDQAYYESEKVNEFTQIGNLDFSPSYGGMKGSTEVSETFLLNSGIQAFATEDVENPDVDPSSKSAVTVSSYSMEKLRLDLGKQKIARATSPKNETYRMSWNHEANLTTASTMERSSAPAYPVLPAREEHESEVSSSLLKTPAGDIASSINLQNPSSSAANSLQEKDE